LAATWSNGKEAVDMAQRRQYELIFMGCRIQHAAGPRVSIVAVTAHVVKGAREECLAAGMDDYLTKPAPPSAFEEMLRRWSP
jgi:DNA-binding response OmpR family regulator